MTVRYRTRTLEIEACPSPIFVGEFAVIIGNEFHHVAAELFHALFDKVTPAPSITILMATLRHMPEVPAPAAEPPVPGLPTSASWSTARALPPPKPRSAYSLPWHCDACDHAAQGRKCPNCGRSHPAIMPRRLDHG